MSTLPKIEFRLRKILTDNSILLKAMQQACSELLNVQSKARAIFYSSNKFNQHIWSHRQTVITLENISSPVAFLEKLELSKSFDISISSSLENEVKSFIEPTCNRGATLG